MKQKTTSSLLIVGVALGFATTALLAHRALAQPAPSEPQGTAAVYGDIADDQIERLTSPERIKAVTRSGAAPTRIWQALEHGEKVDCLDCIPAVESLLYDGNAKNREISAWWLRRRIFGVFGEGEVYQRVVITLTSHADPSHRARAAEALGEFLDGAGVDPVARALTADSAPEVRLAAAHALDRLNSAGHHGELSSAFSDPDARVRASAISAASHIHGFADVAALVGRLSDEAPVVRRHAAAALGAMRGGAREAVPALLPLAAVATESDTTARAEAVHALGLIGDRAAAQAVRAALDDPDTFVRDAAAIALHRL
jgi:HEAT repeat protein